MILKVFLVMMGMVAFADDSDYVSSAAKCSDFKKSDKSCFMEYSDREQRGLCEVCRESKSCFMSISDSRKRGFCEAYREKKSCFMSIRVSLKDTKDRNWCEHLSEGKPCADAFSQNSTERDRCQRGDAPKDHYFWRN